jgi:hypothetical protein
MVRALQGIDVYQLFLIACFTVIKPRDVKLRQSTASQQSLRGTLLLLAMRSRCLRRRCG